MSAVCLQFKISRDAWKTYRGNNFFKNCFNCTSCFFYFPASQIFISRQSCDASVVPLHFCWWVHFGPCQSWAENEGMFALMPAAVIHTYRLVSLLFFSLPEAIAQAQSQLLLGSCNFETSTCGYTSDGEFTSWSLHKDGIGRLVFLCLFLEQ